MGRKLHAVVSMAATVCLPILLGGCKLALLDPKGQIGVDERNLILIALGCMLIVVIPVIGMALYFAWRYRASNDKAVYRPNWDFSQKIEMVVWAVPILIIAVLGVITFKSTHDLEPSKPIASQEKTLHVQVVALEWKWLFIYPEQHIATVNEVAFPANVPVRFDITSDRLMNSFFIPRLGTQIYAMPGMDSKLHLIASEEGTYRGRSYDFSGPGFSGMKFQAKAMSREGFQDWVAKIKQGSSPRLDTTAYQALTKPSENNPAQYFSDADPELFGTIMAKYMKSGMMPHAQGEKNAR